MSSHSFSAALPRSENAAEFPVIDSHIHLFADTHLPNLTWHTPGGPLSKQHSVSEYVEATSSAPLPPNGRFRGFVFVETDRKSHVSPENGGWTHPVEELKFLDRISEGKPVDGEGHSADDAQLCLAIVGWAPVPGGRKAMEEYERQVRAAVSGDTMKKIAGWRYLVQEKPPGTMLSDGFIDSLKWMGENGYSFDLGVDMRSGGLWQLAEAAIMMSQVTAGVPVSRQVKVVINHMCKPDMQGAPFAPLQFDWGHESFASWQRHLKVLAAYPSTYMKLSGALSELPPLPSEQEQQKMEFWERQRLLLDAAEHARSWLSTSIDYFSPERVMFGSDWPVCNVSGGGNSVAFKNWVSIIRGVAATLTNSRAHENLWGLTAARAYQIKL